MNSDHVLCSNLNELVKKLVLTFCEVNVKFSHHLDIYGSIHIRADDTDVVSMLLNEHCVKDQSPSSSNSTINIHVSDDQGNPNAKESYKSTSVAAASDTHYTKVIQSTDNNNCNNGISGQQMPMTPGPGQMLQPRCPLPPLPPNIFTNPMFLDVCNNGMGVPVNDPFRYMGFVQTPVAMATDLRDAQDNASMTADLKANQDNFIATDLKGTQENFMASDSKGNHSNQDTFITSIEPKGNPNSFMTGNIISQEQEVLPEDDLESNIDDTQHEMSATESSMPQPPTDYESDVTVGQPSVLPWQQEPKDKSPEVDNEAAPLTSSTPVNDSDSDSAQDTSSSQGGVTYRCRICRKTYSDMKVYSHHVSVCKYQCPQCTKTFSAKQAFDTHVQEEHNHGNGSQATNNNNNNNGCHGRGRYQCTTCEQHFKSRAALNSHMTFRHRRQQQKTLYS